MTRIAFEDDAAWQTHLDEIEQAKSEAWRSGYEACEDDWTHADQEPTPNPYAIKEQP